MSNDASLVEVVKRNGDFRKNYGLLIGAFLYLRSVSAARGGTAFRNAFVAMTTAGFVAILQKYGWHLLF